ncbi:MAG: cobalt-precorrin-6A reductase [Rhizobiaceae bacterium]
MTFRVLILGGTTEARLLAERLAQDSRFEVTVSLAGRTANPVAHAVPVRSGGFGGASGLADHLRRNRVAMLVDATHPFAAIMSRNAEAAAKTAGTDLMVLRRPPWRPQADDRWTMHRDIAEAVSGLGASPRRVFVTLGRTDLTALFAAPQHRYLVRSVDPVEPRLDLASIDYILDRGPFDVAGEMALLAKWRIEAIVSKNSGGEASRAKLIAARRLGIAVEMVERPAPGQVPALPTVEAAIEALNHRVASMAERGE